MGYQLRSNEQNRQKKKIIIYIIITPNLPYTNFQPEHKAEMPMFISIPQSIR